MQLATYDEKYESDDVVRLNEVVMEMPEQWQKIYKLFFIEEFNKTQISKMLGISDVRVGQLVNKIKNKIKNDEILKKIYR